MKKNWNSLGLGVLLIALTLAAYWPALRGGFIWDDDAYILNNELLRSARGLWRIFFNRGATPQYYPLTFGSFWLEYHLWGLNPLGYHVVNVLLHALAAILLWRILSKMNIRGAWLGAAIFALHPVCVESVAWATERKNVLSGVFYLAAATCYLRFAGWAVGDGDETPAARPGGGGPENHPAVPDKEKSRRVWYALALGAFVAAMLSKSVACSLPAALLLLMWWKKGRLAARDWLPTIPFFCVGALLGLNTVLIEKHHVGASGPEWAFSFLDRFLIAGRALWFYAGKLVWPAELTFIYPRWHIDAGIWWQWLFPLSALGVVLALWCLRNRIGRGPLVGVLFFAGTLVPALGFVNVYPMRYSFVADHFQYLAAVGLIALTAAGLSRFPHRVQMGQVALLLLLGVLTWRQTRIYRNLETLWRDTLAKNSAAWIAHNNLGLLLSRQGRPDEAVEHYQRALELKPDFADAHHNFGLALVKRGQIDAAIAHYRQALQLNPRFADTHCELATALALQGRWNEAIPFYEQALQLKPDHAEAHNNLGVALTALGRGDEPIAHYSRAIELKPDYAEAHYNLGMAMANRGKWTEAIEHYTQALRVNPSYAQAHGDLANALASMGRAAEAAQHYDEALRLKPDYAVAHYNFALLLASHGQSQEAMQHLSKALELATAQNNAALAETIRARLDSLQSASSQHPTP